MDGCHIDDTSILFMGGKKSSFFSLDEVSGKYSSFGTETPDPRIEVGMMDLCLW